MKTPSKPRVLDISDEELHVFECLQSPLNPTELAKMTKIPRTTIAYFLKKMVNRGLVIKTRRGKRFAYTRNGSENLSRLTDELRVFFDPSLSVLTIPYFDGLKAYKGISSIIALHQGLLKAEPKYSRVKVIQPNQSFLNMFDNATVEQVVSMNTVISESKVILDAVIEENAYQVYEEYWELDPEGFSRLNPTFTNRTTDYVTVPSGKISFSNELWIYFDSVVICNYKDKIAVVITNRETRGLVEALYDSLKESGRRINPIVAIESLQNKK